MSEIARYWAAKKLTEISVDKKRIIFDAPFSTKEFTVKVDKKIKVAELLAGNDVTTLIKKNSILELSDSTYFSDNKGSILCFKLPKGKSEINFN